MTCTTPRRSTAPSRWREFRTITLARASRRNGDRLLINALWVFREFTVIYVLTGGGPVGATETLSIWTYLEAFANFHMGFRRRDRHAHAGDFGRGQHHLRVA